MTFTSWPQRIGSALSVTVLGALLGVAGEAAAGVAGATVAGVAVFVLVVRSLRMGVAIGADGVVVRNLFHTVDVPLDEARGFGVGSTAWYVLRGPDEQVHLARQDARPVRVTVMGMPSVPVPAGCGS